MQKWLLDSASPTLPFSNQELFFVGLSFFLFFFQGLHRQVTCVTSVISLLYLRQEVNSQRREVIHSAQVSSGELRGWTFLMTGL